MRVLLDAGVISVVSMATGNHRTSPIDVRDAFLKIEVLIAVVFMYDVITPLGHLLRCEWLFVNFYWL